MAGQYEEYLSNFPVVIDNVSLKFWNHIEIWNLTFNFEDSKGDSPVEKIGGVLIYRNRVQEWSRLELLEKSILTSSSQV